MFTLHVIGEGTALHLALYRGVGAWESECSRVGQVRLADSRWIVQPDIWPSSLAGQEVRIGHYDLEVPLDHPACAACVVAAERDVDELRRFIAFGLERQGERGEARRATYGPATADLHR